MCRMCDCPVAREYGENVHVLGVWLSCGSRVWGKRVCAGCVIVLWPESIGKTCMCRVCGCPVALEYGENVYVPDV